MNDYESENVIVEYCAIGYGPALENFIGKKVKKIINNKYSLKIIFEDDSYIEAQGSVYGGALSVFEEVKQ